MKFSIFISLIVFSSFCGIAQNKGTLKPKQQKMPDKDPVVVIDNIEAGKSKTYHWHSDKLTARASATAKVKFTVVNMLKTVPTVFKVGPKEKVLKVKLNKGINTIVIAGDANTKAEESKVHISIKDGEMQYEITARMKKGENDTLLINRH